MTDTIRSNTATTAPEKINSTTSLLKKNEDERKVKELEKSLRENEKQEQKIKEKKKETETKDEESNNVESSLSDLIDELNRDLPDNKKHMGELSEESQASESSPKDSNVKEKSLSKTGEKSEEPENEEPPVDVKIRNILSEYDDIYIREYLLKSLDVNEYFPASSETLNLLHAYISTYTKTIHFIETNFNLFMLVMLKNVKIDNNSVKLLQCVALCDVNYEYVGFYRKVVGYSKVYNNLKEVISNLFEKQQFMNAEYDHKYIAYLIILLDNDQLVYKNLKPMLSALIKCVKNDIVERNIESCALITRAVVEGAPTLFTDKLVLSFIAYYTKILFNPRNYINLQLDSTAETVDLIFNTYENIDPSYITGFLREALGKMSEFRSTGVFEEIKMINNVATIIPGILKQYLKSNSTEEFITDYKMYLTPKFISQAKESRQNGSKSSRNDNNDNLAASFLSSKYKYLNILLPHFNCYNRIDLVNDLSLLDEPGVVLRHFLSADSNSAYSEYIDWNDLIGLDMTVGSIKYLFDPYFLDNRGDNHIGIIKLISTTIPDDQMVYYTKFASESQCYYILVDLYCRNINSNDFDHTRIRQLVLEAINDIMIKEEATAVLDELENTKIDEINSAGYRNLILVLIVILSKIEPKKYTTDEFTSDSHLSSIEKFTNFTKKFITPENEFSDFYVATLFYLNKDIHRPFHNYFDVIQELMALHVRGLAYTEEHKKIVRHSSNSTTDDNNNSGTNNNSSPDTITTLTSTEELNAFKDKTFPLLFQMTHKEVTEVGVLYNNYQNSRFYIKYLEVLELMEVKPESFKGTKLSTPVETFEEELSSDSTDNLSITTMVDHEKEFLKEQRKIIIEKYDLAQREKELEEEKFKLAEKEHELLRVASEKYSKEQKKLIKRKYKEAKKAQEEMNRQFERIKRQREELERNLAKDNTTKTYNILEDNLAKAKEEHESARDQYLKAKTKYRDGQQRYKDALKDLDLLKGDLTINNNTSNNNGSGNNSTNVDNTLSEEQILKHNNSSPSFPKNDKLKEDGLIRETETDAKLAEFRTGEERSKQNQNNVKNNNDKNNNDKNINVKKDGSTDYSALFNKPHTPK